MLAHLPAVALPPQVFEDWNRELDAKGTLWGIEIRRYDGSLLPADDPYAAILGAMGGAGGIPPPPPDFIPGPPPA